MVQKSGSKTATVFLGGGRITSALCSGLRLGRYKSDLVVYDRNPSKLRALRRESGVEIARDLKSAIERAHMLILAVRPASVLGLLDEIARSGIAPGLCVSLAAGVPLSTLRRSAGAVRWVRAMPSPVCRIGRGLTAITFDRAVTRTQRRQVREFFSMVGQVIEIPERQFDAFTATYSSSHGYHALATLASQGGIAAATMQAMDRTGYPNVVAKGIQAGIQQAERNAKDSAQRSTGRHVL
jgi:pyrroline-5-carboxylate reductase